jgi:hypothetical protein
MVKVVTESPSGLKVAITRYQSGDNAIEIETRDKKNFGWSMWFDNIEDVTFFADVLIDYIELHNLRKEKDNG